MELTEKSSAIEPSSTKTKWWKSRFLFLAGIAQILMSTSISILPAFFPSEAKKKGVSAIESGVIMGAVDMAMAAFSIPWGLVTAKISSKIQLVFSVTGVAVLTLIFGFVDRFPNGSTYVAATFSLRLVIGFGFCVFETAVYTMLPVVMAGRESTGFIRISERFRDILERFRVSKPGKSAVMEMGFGLGYILGPAVGGAFFDLGGFYMPFVVMTVLLFVMGILCLVFISNPVIKPATVSTNWKTFLFCPCTLVYGAVLSSTEADFGFLAVTLEPFLAQFSLSHTAIGGVILCSALAYALTAPVWGYFCDKGATAEYGAFAGSVLACLVFLFLGPIPWFPFGPNLWLIIVSVLGCGLSVAAKMIFGFKMLMNSALIICKFPDNVATYAAVSSLFLLYSNVGALAGQMGGGVLQQYLGTRGGTLVMFFWELFLVFLQGLYLILNKCLFISRKVSSPVVSVTRPSYDDL